MDIKIIFDRCVGVATRMITAVREPMYGDVTPCTEWDVRDLVGHMLYELAWVPDIIGGRAIAEVGSKYDGDLIGKRLQDSWSRRLAPAKEAVRGCRLDAIVHLSYGDFEAGKYLMEQANDQLIHAWDLGKAIGQDIDFDEDVARALYEQALPQAGELAKTGLFAPVKPVAETAPIPTKLLAIYGRSRDWQKP
jgi:uncharacterized protein (TIGR03086 family)